MTILNAAGLRRVLKAYVEYYTASRTHLALEKDAPLPRPVAPKAIIMKRAEGLIKMAIHSQSGEIMGVHVLAPHAGELVAEAMMLVRNKNTIDDVLESLPMFPTLSESIKMVAMAFTRDISKLSCCV